MALSRQHSERSSEAAVVAAIEQMTRAFESADIEQVMQAYDDGAVIAFEPGKPIADRSTIQEMFEQWFALNPRFDYAGHEVFVSDDVALHVAPWHMTGTAADGTRIEQSGLSVAVLRRVDGRWLLAIDNPHGQRLLNSRG
jgi:uncharacterized protein (TIGR02246 family)